MNIETNYYHVPVWMSILIDGLIKAELACRLKTVGQLPDGLYLFHAAYGEEESREDVLFVWNASAERVQKYLVALLPSDANLLVSMAEEYARDRQGREDTKVHRCIIQLLIARAVELFNQEKADETLTINGDFSLVGRLPAGGKLRVNGNVHAVEGSIGEILEIKCEKEPIFHFAGMSWCKEGVWRFTKTRPTCVFPPG